MICVCSSILPIWSRDIELRSRRQSIISIPLLLSHSCIPARASIQRLEVRRVRRKNIQRPIGIISRHPAQHLPLLASLLKDIFICSCTHDTRSIRLPINSPFPERRGLQGGSRGIGGRDLESAHRMTPLVKRKDGVRGVVVAADLAMSVMKGQSIGVMQSN